MSIDQQNIVKLREYAHQVNEKVYDEKSKYGEGVYETRLNKTIQHLQEQIKQHQAGLEELRGNSSLLSIDEPSQDPHSRIHQLRVITSAYKTLTVAEPILPSTNSPLPALLALRYTHNLINETKASLLNTKEKITKISKQIDQEDQDMRDYQDLANALEQRIKKLQVEVALQENVPPDELANTIILDQQRKKSHYAKELRNLMKAFNRFVADYLAAMLAVEEIGGPIIGDLIDINEDTLKAGFNRQGIAKKPKTASPNDEAERQKRIDDIWGPLDEDEELETRHRTEKEAAGSAFRTLCEDLLNASAGDETSDPYIKIPRETAAVRFLVRAKIAQFHSQDARKLRLMDFGRELDD